MMAIDTESPEELEWRKEQAAKMKVNFIDELRNSQGYSGEFLRGVPAEAADLSIVHSLDNDPGGKQRVAREFLLTKRGRETDEQNRSRVVTTDFSLFKFGNTTGGRGLEQISPLSASPSNQDAREAMRIYSNLLKKDPAGMKALDLQQIDDRMDKLRASLAARNTYPEEPAEVRHRLEAVLPHIKSMCLKE